MASGGASAVVPASSGGRLDVAVIGTGITGLSAAWLLSQRHQVTVFEKASWIGGHSNTVDLPPAGGHPSLPVDTGFIVYNEPSYPNLTALFAHLGVATQASDMSFSVSAGRGAMEYGGGSLRALLAQRRNLVRPRFWSMLRDLLRFYKTARGMAAELGDGGPDAGVPETLGAWLDRHGFGTAFQQDHLLPMAAAIWSCPPGQMRDIPALAFIRFCQTHGLLQISDRPQWRTVTGGSRAYVQRLSAPFADRIRVGLGVRMIRREAGRVLVQDDDGRISAHDHVVLACHADQALGLLADPTAQEQAVLGAFRTIGNVAVLHTDPALMPRRRAVWSAWNYLVRESHGAGRDEPPPGVTYWMNRLQGLPEARPVFLSLNPPRRPAAERVLGSMRYDHPVLDVAALRAQRQVWGLQGQRRSWFCGAWCGAGFHEDGLQAGLAVAEALGGLRRPWRVEDESGRIHLPAGFVDRAQAQEAAWTDGTENEAGMRGARGSIPAA